MTALDGALLGILGVAFAAGVVFLCALNTRHRLLLWSLILIAAAVIVVIFALPQRLFVPQCSLNPRNTCMHYLRQIDGAKEQWGLENHKTEGDLIVPSEVNAYIKGGGPTCPSGGTYRYGKLGDPPRCSIQGHTIE